MPIHIIFSFRNFKFLLVLFQQRIRLVKEYSAMSKLIVPKLLPMRSGSASAHQGGLETVKPVRVSQKFNIYSY